MSNLQKLSDIPTDNLYKFLTIVGLVLMVTGTMVQWRTASPAIRGAARVKALMELRRINADSYVKLSERLQDDMREHDTVFGQGVELVAAQKADLILLETSDPASPEASDRLNEVNKRNDAISVHLGKAKELLANLNAEMALAKQAESRGTVSRETIDQELVDVVSDLEVAQFASSRALWMVVFGGGLTLTGFLLWYLMLQRYLDVEVAQFGKTMEPIDETADKAKATDDAPG